MPKKTERSHQAKAAETVSKQDRLQQLKGQRLSKGAMAAERASAGIGTDDRDPDNWYRPTKRA
jgi:hypothetical protein